MKRYIVTKCDRCPSETHQEVGETNMPPGWGWLSFEKYNLPNGTGRYVTSDTFRFVELNGRPGVYEAKVYLCPSCISAGLTLLSTYIGEEAQKAVDSNGPNAMLKLKAERDWLVDRCAALYDVFFAATGGVTSTGFKPTLENEIKRFRVFDAEQKQRQGVK